MHAAIGRATREAAERRMTTQSLFAIFDAAEKAFLAGRLEEARRHLMALQEMGERHAAISHMRGIVEHRLGNSDEAIAQLEQAIAVAPNDPQLANNHGNVLRDLGRNEEALHCYDRALMLLPGMPPAMLNRALVLESSGRAAETRRELRTMVQRHPAESRGWTALGAVEKAAGDLAAAAASFDRALALQPADPAALGGRARVALERAEPDVIARYEHAVRVVPDDRQFMLDEAEALTGARLADPLRRLTAAVGTDPRWAEGQLALARLRWEWGEKGSFNDAIEAALAVDPDNAPLWAGYVTLLGDCRLDEAAADAAARARLAGGGEAHWALAEAIHAGRAGDPDRAERLFAALPKSLPGRASHEAVHWLRRSDYARACTLIDQALDEDRANISNWAVAELLWRKLSDPRAEWLSGQPGLVATFDAPWDDELAAADALLERLHRDNIECAGQSVREGTQTRWNLFDRLEPVLIPLRERLDNLVARYLAGLPPRDDTHPLFRHRDAPMRITASWSVRLTGAGRHVSHFHPGGLVSSAFYFRVPNGDETTGEGVLDLGTPPDDFRMELVPLASIQPQAGRLVLFPSYLMHGTRSFSSGERMSVAFDVAKAEA